ncbi:MAG: hypothetical protein WC197_06940 [Candidatus Gastranaerophilaceae bacterium]|jgi:hypothetical protein
MTKNKNFLNYFLSPLGVFFEQSIVINKIEQEKAFFHKLKKLEIEKEIKINKLRPQAVFVHNKNLNQSAKEKCRKYPLNLNIVKIFNLSRIFIEKIKWFYKSLKFQSIVRNHNVQIQKNSLVLNSENTNLFTFSKKLSPNDLMISRKLRITEEIVGIEPYIRKASLEKLISCPVTKTPVIKSEFSKNEIDFFREKLALQVKTVKFNINILNIYEKFVMGMFSSIKQDENSSKIFCYFDKKNNKISENDIYYLVIGVRKDNNQLVKTLIKPQDLKEIKSN